MAQFDLSKYETVAHRIERFYGDHPAASIVTELVELHRTEDGRPAQYVVKATIVMDGVTRATGYAEEIVGASPVNRTSALENAETSAVGRALANFNYAPSPSKGGNRPSREEMEKVQRYGEGRPR